jgi:hypothetical protein
MATICYCSGWAVTLALAIDLIMALTVARKTRDDKDIRNH